MGLCSPFNLSEMMCVIGGRCDLPDAELVKAVMLSKTFTDNIRDVSEDKMVDWDYIQSELEKELNMSDHDLCKRDRSFDLKVYFADYYRREMGLTCEETLRDFEDAHLFNYIEVCYIAVGGEAPENFLVSAGEKVGMARSA